MKIYIALWLMIFGKLIVTAPLYANEKILIYTNSYEPYYGEKMPEFGPAIKITVLSFKETGYDTEVRFRPWARALREGENGECDMIVGVWYNTGRENWMALTDSMLENEIGFYKQKNDALVFKDYTDLKVKKIVVGTVRGYINPVGLIQAGVITDEVTRDLQNMKKLVAGRIGLALVDKNLGVYLLEKEDMADEVEWLVTLQKNPLRNGIMKNAKGDWKRKLAAFNKGLAIVKSKGIVDQVLKEFHLQ